MLGLKDLLRNALAFKMILTPRIFMESGDRQFKGSFTQEMQGWRFDRALASSIDTLSRERIKTLISSGKTTINDQINRDPSYRIKDNASWVLTLPAATPAHNIPQNIALDIVFEDDHLLVVDKPAGMVVHPAAGNLDGTLVNALLHHCSGRLSGIGGVARPGIVHRIDKDTSGLLVVAKTDPAHEGLAKQFAAHTIGRVYKAIVSGKPTTKAGRIEASLARSPLDRKKIAICSTGKGKRAVTHWVLSEPLKDAARIECRLETGRTHQVRVHMASIGHPLVGDPVYGKTRPSHKSILAELDFKRQALHAAELNFLHPITKSPLTFLSPTPSDIVRLLDALRL
jgi:23S rRNA pseudouridine1911/1915/1917 synthase